MCTSRCTRVKEFSYWFLSTPKKGQYSAWQFGAGNDAVVGQLYSFRRASNSNWLSTGSFRCFLQWTELKSSDRSRQRQPKFYNAKTWTWASGFWSWRWNPSSRPRFYYHLNFKSTFFSWITKLGSKTFNIVFSRTPKVFSEFRKLNHGDPRWSILGSFFNG